ncbi:DEAD/DEAH box helicase family protein [Anaerolineales bacterium HSG24]|nr:DEAD/DEAH box helicase family protein [Anaerolineales bacterium HSG24]
MSNFIFLKTEWPTIYPESVHAEQYINNDPRTACFYARRALELFAQWLYQYDHRYQAAYNNNLNALIKGRSFQQYAPLQVKKKAEFIRRAGNEAAHERQVIRDKKAMQVVKELFEVMYWLGRTYGSQEIQAQLPEQFDETHIPPSLKDRQKRTITTLKKLMEQHEEKNRALQEFQADLEAVQREKEAVQAKYEAQQHELSTLRAQQQEIATLQAKLDQYRQTNEQIPDTHNYDLNEAETRELLIDMLLREAGWNPHGENVAEYKVIGMPNATGLGYVDYVLWGDDGLPLAVVEAKKSGKNPETGRQQAKLYADCLESKFAQRPIIFYSNGYETYLWDDYLNIAPRQVQGFYTQDDLARLIQRRPAQDATTLQNTPIRDEIVDRYYQQEAIRQLTKHFGRRYRKGLLVMATGTGKTRTAIALVDLLQRANWVKRTLFLADRTALVDQAIKNFKAHLPLSNPVNLQQEKEAQANRVVVSTYHTMLNQLDRLREDGTRQFSVAHFDLVIIDEAHRSVYQKFGAIFDYFDSFLLGLTATPRDEIDRNTYRLFELEEGVPIYAYHLDEAVQDGFLVPPKALSVPVKFLREGIKYDDLTDAERAEWDDLEWAGSVPEVVDASALNKWLFNQDTVDQVLGHLMKHGLKVAGGDRLGKTIIFAKSQNHADFILKRFEAHYPYYSDFARVISHQITYAHDLIEKFGKADSPPHIAISIDMLDTGIDVPEVVNLVFFKLVRSKTKFLQMIGRGTRLCLNLFGPEDDKVEFLIFDFCQNFEFFDHHPQGIKTRLQLSLSQRLFNQRLNLLDHLRMVEASDDEAAELAHQIRDQLHARVEAMPLKNISIRDKRRYVEPYQHRNNWNRVGRAELTDLEQYVAPLPSGYDTEQNDTELAKRFDNLMLQLQRAMIEGETGKNSPFQRLQQRVMEMAHNLEEASSIPAVQAQYQLIQSLQQDDFWQTVTLSGLEQVRLALRGLVGLILKQKNLPLFTDFKDELGMTKEVQTSYLVTGVNEAQYRKKVEQFIRANADTVAINKIRWALPLDETDLKDLEKLLFTAPETGSREEFEQAFGKQENLGQFIRGLVGLDRRAAKRAFGDYLDNKNFTADQISFITYIIDQLTENGTVELKILYERPYTDLHEAGLDGLFVPEVADEILDVLRGINRVVV